MLFSIIVPMYNVEYFIEKCVRSILEQDFYDYELILVDDGSKDSTVLIAEKIKNEYLNNRNIKIIKKENSGASETRNKGLEIAQGKYIIFMDSDDEMLPNSLSTMSMAAKSNSDLYVFSLKKRNGNEIFDSELSKVKPFSIQYEKSLDVLQEYLKRTSFRITWQPWSKLFKREIIENNKVRFDQTLYSCNDFNFFFSYFFNVKSMEFSNIPITVYTTERDGAISTTKIMRRLQSNTFAYAKLFHDVMANDATKVDLLDYASHLFLCVFDYCSDLGNKDIEEAETIIRNNRDVYCYSKRKTAVLKRFLIKTLGLKRGASVYISFRSIGCSLLKLQRESGL